MQYIPIWEKDAWDSGVATGIQQGIQTGIQTGIQQGTQKTRMEAVNRMLQKGSDYQYIADVFSITMDELMSICEEIKKQPIL